MARALAAIDVNGLPRHEAGRFEIEDGMMTATFLSVLIAIS
jgi:hypothetical protein